MKQTIKILTFYFLAFLIVGCSAPKVPKGFNKSLSEIANYYDASVGGIMRTYAVSTDNEGKNYIVEMSGVSSDILSYNSPSDISSVASVLVFMNLDSTEFTDSDKITFKLTADNSSSTFDYKKPILEKSIGYKEKADRFIKGLDNNKFNECINMIEMEIIGADTSSLVELLSSLEKVEYGELKEYSVYGFESASEVIEGKNIDLFRVKVGFNYENSQHTGELVFIDSGKMIGFNM